MDQDDDDDAMCNDIPQPDIGFLANAFRPAYIDVFEATSQATPDTGFIYHVTAYNCTFQGAKGRENSFPNSSEGYWEVEIQQSYEGRADRDNDPDDENAFLGSTYQSVPTYSFVFFETIRDVSNEYNADDYFALRDSVLHEIGHFFRLDDNSGGVMGNNPPGGTIRPHFINCQIKVIRRCVLFPEWSQQHDTIPQDETCSIESSNINP